MKRDSDENLDSDSDESLESDSEESTESDSDENLYGVDNPAVKSLLFWNLPVVEMDDLEALANDFVKHIEKACPYAEILDRWPKRRTRGAELAFKRFKIKMEEGDVDAPICSYMVVHFETREQADRVYKRLRHTKYDGHVINVHYTRVPTYD